MNKKISVAVSVLAATMIFATGCGKKPGAGGGTASAPAAEKHADEKKAAAPAAGIGSIKGVVKFSGEAPDMPELNRQSDPFCAKTKMQAQFVVLNENKTLKNVAVRVLEVSGGEPSKAKVTVDQKNCMYEPRVQTTWDGEEIEIVNSDPTLHNVHTYAGTKTLFNRAQPKGSPAIKKSFKKDDGEIVKFKCDVHPWMTGWLIVNDSGFSGVSDGSGAFEIKGVPAGTYTLKSFQEKYGEKEIKVTVEADKVAEVEFTYDGSEQANYKFREVYIGRHDHHH